MRTLLIATVVLLVASAVAEESKTPEKREITPVKDHLCCIEELGTFHEQVGFIDSFLKDLNYLADRKDEKTDEEKKLYSEFTSLDTLKRVREHARILNQLLRGELADPPEDQTAEDKNTLAGDLVIVKRQRLALDAAFKSYQPEAAAQEEKKNAPPPQPPAPPLPGNPSKADQESLAKFLDVLIKVTADKKYEELARNHLGFPYKISDDEWPKALPQITMKLEKKATHGGLELMKLVKGDPKNWYQLEDGMILLYHSGLPYYNYLRCKKDADGTWKLHAISSGLPQELEALGEKK